MSQLSDKSGIYNKQTFIEKTQEMLENNKGEPYIFMRFDLDRFKVFNDLFGFAEGDKVLSKIGEWFLTLQKLKVTYGHIHADHFILCGKKSEISPEVFLPMLTDFLSSVFPSFDFKKVPTLRR